MDTKWWVAQTRLIIAGLLVVLLGLAGCVPAPAPVHIPTTVPPTAVPTVVPTAVSTSAPTPLPTLSLDQTYARQYVIDNFDVVHSPVNGDTNKYLILGNLPVSKPVADLPPELAVYLGRWEGYVYAPPVNKDRKIVLVIQEITA